MTVVQPETKFEWMPDLLPLSPKIIRATLGTFRSPPAISDEDLRRETHTRVSAVWGWLQAHLASDHHDAITLRSQARVVEVLEGRPSNFADVAGSEVCRAATNHVYSKAPAM